MAIRPKRLGSRAALLLLGVIVALQAAATLQEGEPDYRNHYNQPVSAHVAFLIGLAAVAAALVPWRESSSDRQRELRARGVPRLIQQRSDPAGTIPAPAVAAGSTSAAALPPTRSGGAASRSADGALRSTGRTR